MGVRRVVVRIERVVLRGFGELDTRTYAAALQAALGRHLASPDALQALTGAPGLRPALRATLDVARQSDARVLGERTARSVAGAMRT